MAAGSPPLPAQCGVHRAIADGVDELGVVAIVLAGVVVGELRHRCVERSAVADVGVNRRSITCCRMGAGEYSTTFLANWPNHLATCWADGMTFMSRNWRT